ncbi:hypothetical protein VB834_25510 [Limnoraphis robusta Tam1]|uniref:Uncharacterized protein n=1 Tax=Limnoraphis robusta CCNP1315 TaxID=3110306 RepID=A0ABU5TR70_9CYAN|nr:hypothetical protein [Limnoraphis robusta]MEA5498452.1 hypothetical protein [Limnoraphis robusta BA-68 BA1]MEA5517418.1 hypothetical protein [Limnoraphis robusta CCNP1315]MEA5542393.1 hypothetical protein [Limnoraphis robusta Tam1]MEA5545994.1 hypothetical protein [Limnoraphis robusta CCNP1324]
MNWKDIDRKQIVIVVLAIICVGVLLAITLSDGRPFNNNNRNALVYENLYNEQKVQIEDMRKRVLELTGENERLKSDLQGGRSTAEEQEALAKKGQELDRRENFLNKKEDKLIADRVDLENNMRDFYDTMGTTREEVGQAKQIKIDYDDTKKLLDQTLKERNNWRSFFYGLLVTSVIVVVILVLYALKLNYIKTQLERFVEMLKTELKDPSVSVDRIRTQTNTFIHTLQLTDEDKSQKALKSSSELNGGNFK